MKTTSEIRWALRDEFTARGNHLPRARQLDVVARMLQELGIEVTPAVISAAVAGYRSKAGYLPRFGRAAGRLAYKQT